MEPSYTNLTCFRCNCDNTWAERTDSEVVTGASEGIPFTRFDIGDTGNSYERVIFNLGPLALDYALQRKKLSNIMECIFGGRGSQVID